MLKKLSIFMLLVGMTVVSRGQDVAIKTNVLSDAFLNANGGIEVGLAPRWSADLSGEYNGWTIDGHKWKHWLVQPEVRYWFCDHFAGHFVGFHALGGQYNIGQIKNSLHFLGTDFSDLSTNRHQGWFVGAGLAYGYSWILGRNWNFEAEIGVGYAYTRYDVFECAGCGKKVSEDNTHHYVGPTKAAVNLIFTF